MSYTFIAILSCAVLLEVAADILFKQWSHEGRTLLLGSGLALYFIGTVFWAYSLRFEYLTKAVTVFTVLNLVFVLLAGALLFDEQLSLINKIGVLLGIGSVILMQL